MIVLSSGQETARWTMTHPELLAYVVEEILREEAWWMAVRARKYASPTMIWADRSNEAPANLISGSHSCPAR
jgi:hypothetical protein